MKKQPLDVTDDRAMEPIAKEVAMTTPTSFNIKGLPTPPAGWGKQTTPGPMPAEMC